MAERKVLSFPSRSVEAGPYRPRCDYQHQPSLFGDGADGRGKVAFIDIKILTEEPFLRILTMNGVRAVVDLRPVPVFERPRFRHRQVVFYFHDRHIQYVEFAFTVKRPVRMRSDLAAMQGSDLYGKIEKALENGLALCLYDEASRELGWLDEMRRILRLSNAHLAELNPRSLIGMPG